MYGKLAFITTFKRAVVASKIFDLFMNTSYVNFQVTVTFCPIWAQLAYFIPDTLMYCLNVSLESVGK